MRRWHAEVALMHRRWRIEMDAHGYDWRCPPTDPSACHCAQGVGSMRKRTPWGHSKRCWLCKGPKYMPKARATKNRREIEFELSAFGFTEGKSSR
jgi:hypothetical protein